MSVSKKVFNITIRVVFVFAFGAFLWASLHHIATYFHNFEPAGTDWSGSYALAIGIDGTALMLTIGMMFFSEDKSRVTKVLLWVFIVLLMCFSWFVNWEYAVRYQSLDLTQNTVLTLINPIIASSFAFFNLAYSVVSELFGSRAKTPEQLQAEIDAIDARFHLEQQLKNRQGPNVLQQAKVKALELKTVAKEVFGNDEKNVLPVPPKVFEEVFEDDEINVYQTPLSNVLSPTKNVYSPTVQTPEQTVLQTPEKSVLNGSTGQINTSQKTFIKHPTKTFEKVNNIRSIHQEKTPDINTKRVMKNKVSNEELKRLVEVHMTQEPNVSVRRLAKIINAPQSRIYPMWKTFREEKVVNA